MKNFLIIISLFLTGTILSGCAALGYASLAGHVAGGDVKGKTIALSYETDLNSKSKILSLYRQVGTELGWELTTESPEILVWKVSETNRLDEYFGKVSTTSFYASVMPDSQETTTKTLRLSACISGNYNEAVKEKVDGVISGFEEKLAALLSESGHSLTKKEEE